MNTENETPYPGIYAVPRRYDIATMFTVTVAFALLFCVMRALQFQQRTFLFLALLITFVGAAQPLLFSGKNPRLASIAAGAVFCGGYALIQSPVRGGWLEMVAVSLWIAAYGCVGGYFAGVIAGGVFLVAQRARQFGRRARDQQHGGGPTQH